MYLAQDPLVAGARTLAQQVGPLHQQHQQGVTPFAAATPLFSLRRGVLSGAGAGAPAGREQPVVRLPQHAGRGRQPARRAAGPLGAGGGHQRAPGRRPGRALWRRGAQHAQHLARRRGARSSCCKLLQCGKVGSGAITLAGAVVAVPQGLLRYPVETQENEEAYAALRQAAQKAMCRCAGRAVAAPLSSALRGRVSQRQERSSGLWGCC